LFGAMAIASDLTRVAISSGISGMLNGYRSGNGLNAIQGGMGHGFEKFTDGWIPRLPREHP